MSKKDAQKGIFPRFTRFIPALAPRLGRALGNGLVWSVLLLILFANIVAGRNMLPTNGTKFMRAPDSGSAPRESVLGESAADATSQQDLEDQYVRWQSVIEERPDYRDGYYMLSLLAYQLNLLPESRRYLDTVKRLDPNYDGIRRMEALLSPRE